MELSLFSVSETVFSSAHSEPQVRIPSTSYILHSTGITQISVVIKFEIFNRLEKNQIEQFYPNLFAEIRETAYKSGWLQRAFGAQS